MQRIRRRVTAGLVALIALSLLAIPATAGHSWGGYHWARTSNPFTLTLGDNVDGTWDSYLATASSDWSAAVALDTTIGGGGTNPKNCRATSGRIEVCNAKYGRNGWLGLAQVWVSDSHITQGTAKLNDTYFNTATYNKPEWRLMVMCQEIAHDFGLDHQDEAFDNANLGSCMDYTSNPLGPPSNEHPNQHDYDQIETIYQHPDETTTITSSPSGAAAAGEIGNEVSEWGQAIRVDERGRPILFQRDLGGGEQVFTWVIWTLEARGQGQEGQGQAGAPASESKDTAKDKRGEKADHGKKGKDGNDKRRR